MNHNVLMTGATGFVGSHLLLELLTQTNANIFCLVRPKDTSPQQRLEASLEQIILNGKYDASLSNQIKTRCHAVAGDLAGDISAVINQLPHNIEQFWHCAASLNYEERYADEITAINIDGTKKALALARTLSVKHFNYISTAYVAGRNTGVILETPIDEVTSSNFYEQSKVAAEKLIGAETSMKTRIFRPSIVIGHSETFHAINFSGLYGFLRRLIQFKGMMDRVQRGYLDRESVRMCVDAHIPLNLVPVDMVARQAIAISRSHSEANIFHLTNPRVPTVGETLDVVFASAGVVAPRLVDNKKDLNWIDEKFNEKIEFYSSYLTGYKKFDRTNSDDALAEAHATTPYAVTSANLREYCDWYSDLLLSSRRAMPASR